MYEVMTKVRSGVGIVLPGTTLTTLPSRWNERWLLKTGAIVKTDDSDTSEPEAVSGGQGEPVTSAAEGAEVEKQGVAGVETPQVAEKPDASAAKSEIVKDKPAKGKGKSKAAKGKPGQDKPPAKVAEDPAVAETLKVPEVPEMSADKTEVPTGDGQPAESGAEEHGVGDAASEEDTGVELPDGVDPSLVAGLADEE